MKHHLKIASLWAFTFGMVAWVAGIAMFVIGPKVETAVLPVVDHVKAVAVEVDSDREILHLAATGKKERQCEWKAITAMVHKAGTWHQGKVYFTDPRKNSRPSQEIAASRPIGVQSLGEIFVFPAGDRVQVFLWHDCHPFWQTMTFLYELDLNSAPQQVR